MFALVESFGFFDVADWGRASAAGMVVAAGGRLLGVGVALACGDVVFVVVGDGVVMDGDNRRRGEIVVVGVVGVGEGLVEGEIGAGGSRGEGEGDVEVQRGGGGGDGGRGGCGGGDGGGGGIVGGGVGGGVGGRTADDRGGDGFRQGGVF